MPREQVANAALASDMARRNLLVNGGFEVWQRGSAAFVANLAFTADRWQIGLAGTDTLSVIRDTLHADASSNVCAACTFVLGTGAGSTFLKQELKSADGHQLQGRTVSLSMRVNASVANAVRINLQSDGTGPVNVSSAFHAGGSVYSTLTVTATIPGNASIVYAVVYFAASCTAYLDNAMLVVGSVAADYAPLHPADDLARCLRYYEVFGGVSPSLPYISAYSAANDPNGVNVFFAAKKAATPTVTPAPTGWTTVNSNQTVPVVFGTTAHSTLIYCTAAALGRVSMYANPATVIVESNP